MQNYEYFIRFGNNIIYQNIPGYVKNYHWDWWKFYHRQTDWLQVIIIGILGK